MLGAKAAAQHTITVTLYKYKRFYQKRLTNEELYKQFIIQESTIFAAQQYWVKSTRVSTEAIAV